jgi:hypothetical protein
MSAWLVGLGALAVWFAHARGVAKGLAQSERAGAARSQYIEGLYRLHYEEKEAWTRCGHARQEFERACWANEYRGTSDDEVIGALRARHAAERAATIAHDATLEAIDSLLRAQGEVGVADVERRAADLASQLANLDARSEEDVEAVSAGIELSKADAVDALPRV